MFGAHAALLLFALCSASAGAQALSTSLGAIRGVVTSDDGVALAGAHVTLQTSDGNFEGETVTSPDGAFRLAHLPSSSHILTVSLQGFTPASTRITVPPDDEAAVSPIPLPVAPVSISVDVVATPEEMAEAQVQAEEKQRLLGVLPNFFVSYNWNAAPLTARQKFHLAFKNAADPGNLLLVGTVAGVQQATDSFPGYGQGALGYGRRYGADLGNLVVGTYMGGAILPALFHQDPRYFVKGNGTTRSRLLHALSSVIVCRGDNGRRQPALAADIGDLSAGAISNLYYAPSDRRGAALTLTNGLLGIAGDAMNAVFQEFFLQKLTRNAPPREIDAPRRP